MTHDTRARFDARAEAWADYNQQPLGRIRREVSWHNLALHLALHSPSAAGGLPLRPLRALDAGGGSGELTLRLLERGFHVWLLDYAPAMLEQARRAAQHLPRSARDRLTTCQANVEDVSQFFSPGFFDVVTCHTLIEYVPDPSSALHVLSRLLCSGGLLSVSFVNRHAEVLRQAWSRADPLGALARMEAGRFRASLFDISGTAYTADEVGAWLVKPGLTLTATYGVRAFADFVPRERLEDPDFFEALLRLEKAATARSPYKLLARYIQLIAHNQIDPQQ
jgi:S-adenosylmethionine-dependent methyltransferase